MPACSRGDDGGMGEPAGACTERELLAPVALCRPDGRLAEGAIGWARSPLVDCSLPGRWGRRKRWDFWCITAPGLAMNLTVADVDYLGLADVWFRDLEAGREATKTAPRLLPRRLPLAAHAGAAHIDHHGLGLEVAIDDGEEGTAIRARFASKHGPFEADVLVEQPSGHESLTVVIPWGDRRYQCTTKDVGRPARGRIRWGDRSWDLQGDGDAWGCLDFGRGRWPYRIRWNWGAAAGRVAGRTVGLQLGGRWTDGTGMTENALVVDGRLSKLSEELVWDYDTSDWLAPWRIRTPRSDRLDVTFTPVHDKVSRLQAGIAASSVDQCFGTYAGRIVPDDGEPIEVRDLFGWAEEATWRW
jgi:hypothetical protein